MLESATPTQPESQSVPYAEPKLRTPDGSVHPTEPSYLSAIALGFPGVLLLIFGLPMALTLPVGAIYGYSRLNWIGYVLLIATTAIGSTFVYASCLLLRAAGRFLTAARMA